MIGQNGKKTQGKKERVEKERWSINTKRIDQTSPGDLREGPIKRTERPDLSENDGRTEREQQGVVSQGLFNEKGRKKTGLGRDP